MIKRVFEKNDFKDIVVEIVEMVHGWVGHLARLSGQHPIVKVDTFRTVGGWKVKQAIYATLDQKNRLQTMGIVCIAFP